MAKDTFEFPCPCCGKRIEVNVRSGRARALRFDESKRGDDLDGLLEKAKGDRDRRDAMFDDLHDEHRHDAERLDSLFKDATKEAEKDRDKRPPSPFDLD